MARSFPSFAARPGLRGALLFALALAILPSPVPAQPAGVPASPAPGAKEIVRAIAGVYKKRFANRLVQGGMSPAENILELVELDGDAIYLRTHVEFFNGHVCALHGRATYSSEGVFALDGQPPGDGRAVCRLKIAVTAEEIHLLDPEGACNRTCGMRGHLDGVAFPRAARREISYMERLKKSAEFQEATAPH